MPLAVYFFGILNKAQGKEQAPLPNQGKAGQSRARQVSRAKQGKAGQNRKGTLNKNIKIKGARAPIRQK